MKSQKNNSMQSMLVIGMLGLAGGILAPQVAQAQPYVGEIACGGWNFCPSGWGECNGSLLPISENEALFSLIGTTYGGDGQSTFAVPNIQARAIVHQGTGPGLSNRVIGETGGVESVALTTQQIPAHRHALVAHTGTEKSASPTNKIAGTAPTSAPIYASVAPNTTLKSDAVSSTGGSQPHNNLQPYLVAKCCIALFGIFPSPN